MNYLIKTTRQGQEQFPIYRGPYRTIDLANAALEDAWNELSNRNGEFDLFAIDKSEDCWSYSHDVYIVEVVPATYDVVFHDNDSSNSKGFARHYDYCLEYIVLYNGKEVSYFADYQGGTVQIVCNETEKVVYSEYVEYTD